MVGGMGPNAKGRNSTSIRQCISRLPHEALPTPGVMTHYTGQYSSVRPRIVSRVPPFFFRSKLVLLLASDRLFEQYWRPSGGCLCIRTLMVLQRVIVEPPKLLPKGAPTPS